MTVGSESRMSSGTKGLILLASCPDTVEIVAEKLLAPESVRIVSQEVRYVAL